jgi:hypothetical protein
MKLKKNCTFYCASIENVGPKAPNLSYEKRNLKLWKVLKDDFSEKTQLSVATPNGEKTFAREYLCEPVEGFASVIYTCDNMKYLVNYFITDHSLDIGIDNRCKDNANVSIIAEALECSLNKVLAKQSLSIKLKKSSLDIGEKVTVIFFNYVLGNLSHFK